MYNTEGAIIHANAMQMYGCGILITGDTGSGKSKLCQQLIKRGHAIIADDAVALTIKKQQLIAAAPSTTYDTMSLAGQLLSISQTFGESTLIQHHPLHLHVALDITHHQFSQQPHTQKLKQIHYRPRPDAREFELLVQNALD